MFSVRQRFLTSLHSPVSCVFSRHVCKLLLIFVSSLVVVCVYRPIFIGIREHVVFFSLLWNWLPKHSRCFFSSFYHVKLLLYCMESYKLQEHLHWNKHPMNTNTCCCVYLYSHNFLFVHLTVQTILHFFSCFKCVCVSGSLFRHTIIILLFSCKSSNRVVALNIVLLLLFSRFLLLVHSSSLSSSNFYCSIRFRRAKEKKTHILFWSCWTAARIDAKQIYFFRSNRPFTWEMPRSKFKNGAWNTMNPKCWIRCSQLYTKWSNGISSCLRELSFRKSFNNQKWEYFLLFFCKISNSAYAYGANETELWQKNVFLSRS